MKKLLSINLDEDVLRAVDRLAKEVGISRSGFVNLQLRCLLNEWEQYKPERRKMK